ncbi:hypothetical protein GCM10023093_12530 [Nemorincola caseinilytica]|uniref:histidine kinase n=1 Tax=Nemorincola caseinilytica TaxID=2054315 RepID=A0ABP8N9M6_9BACT
MALVSLFCAFVSPYIGYHVVAFILLLTVSFIAMLFDIVPVLLTALLSAVVWDFFFIPPYFTFIVSSAEDAIFLMMYFVVALTSAALTYKIRQVQKVARQKEERINTIRLYNTLLNSLSHELRTPIATIIAATDNLQHSNARLTDTHRSDLVSEIAIASMKLNQHVENLLNMSRLESGFIQLKYDWCDMSELLYDTVRKIEENKVSQKILVQVAADMPLARTDKGMLEQVLYNLLSNATLYTPASSTISISAAAVDNVLELVVEDNGPGFPPQEIDMVFEKFYRLRNTATGGTGLGLSIVRGFAEAMDGTVTLQNRVEGGARFTVKLPAEMSYLKNLKHE